MNVNSANNRTVNINKMQCFPRQLSGVLSAVVSQLVVVSQNKLALPPHLTLLDEPA